MSFTPSLRDQLCARVPISKLALRYVALEKHGDEWRGPSPFPAIANWTAKHIAKTHNLSPWRGFHGERDWNPNWGSMGYSPNRAGNGARPVPPHSKPATPVHIENVMVLDGKEIARNTTKHITNAATHPTTAPYHDGSRHWTPPDAGIIGI